MKRSRLTLFTLLVSLAVTGCNIGKNADSSSQGELSLSFDELTLRVNQSVKVDVTLTANEGVNPEVYFLSSNDNVAKVNDKGYITGVQPGMARIGAFTSDGKLYDYLTVTVDSNNREDSAIKVNTTNVNYHYIDSKQYVAGSGEQNVLVIPVYFPDDSAKATEENREFIEMSFFGSNEDCGWRSFHGYYETASYDKLNYSGHVAEEWYQTTYTKQQVLDDQNTSQYIADAALNWFKKKYPSFDLAPYDSNGDKYIDSLYIIYASDYQVTESGTTNLWGYRWSVYNPTGSGYKASAFSWFSLKFLKETGSYGGVPSDGSNTRVIIHEHGHMLGLPDYYDYGYTGIDCVGGFDMQSYNSFDWNAYSKYSVGWVNPYYVDEKTLKEKGEETITLSASAFNGDCLIVPTSKWNGTPFDEYLMIELFNPELGNNEYDYNYSNYSGIAETGFGVKIFHVDARIFAYQKDGVFGAWKKLDSFDKMSKLNGYYFFANDNDAMSYEYHAAYSKSYLGSEFENYHFLHLLQKENVRTFDLEGDYRHSWIQSDLWQTGDTFCIGEHAGYTNYGPNFFYKTNTFNDDSVLNYGISFDEVTPDHATLTFKYFE